MIMSARVLAGWIKAEDLGSRPRKPQEGAEAEGAEEPVGEDDRPKAADIDRRRLDGDGQDARNIGLGAEQQLDTRRRRRAGPAPPLHRHARRAAARRPDPLRRRPSGAIVPDIARKLPGRGVWVTADAAAVEAAVKASAFAKSLKRQVKVSPDLPQRVDALFVAAPPRGPVAGQQGRSRHRPDSSRSRSCSTADVPWRLLHGVRRQRPMDARKLDRKFTAIQREKGQSTAHC